jgi:hypothetical protein
VSLLTQFVHGAAERADMAMTRSQLDGAFDRAGPFIDLLEDVLHLDQPVRPSVRRRVDAANSEAIRTLRQMATEDETLLAPDNARTICNAVAHRHGVKPRFMLPMRKLGEQLTLEFASALMPSGARSRLISTAVQLDRRRAVTDPNRRRTTDQRPDPRVEWMALAQAMLAVAAVITAALMAASGRSLFGLGLAIASVSFLVFARAALAISSDRRCHLLTSERFAAPPAHRAAQRRRGLVVHDNDLRGPEV